MTWQPGAPKSAAAGIDTDMSKLRDYIEEDGRQLDELLGTRTPGRHPAARGCGRGQLTANDRKAIESAYRDAGVRAGTPREIASATGQIEFLRDVAKSSKRQPIKRLADSLEELRKALTGET